MDPHADKFRTFRWSVREVEGHDHQAIRDALKILPSEPGKPSCLIAHSTKGKGVRFMVNEVLSHYRNPNDHQLVSCLDQLLEDE
jgi:transketolase